MRAQLLAWQPFPSPLYRLDFSDGHVQAFAMDAEAVNAVPSGAAIWPEGLPHAAGTDGLRLVRCIEGLKASVGPLANCVPVAGGVMNLAIRIGRLSAVLFNSPTSRYLQRKNSWQRPVRPISGLEDLGQRLRGQERLLGGAIALALFGGTGFVAHGAWDAWQARARAVAGWRPCAMVLRPCSPREIARFFSPMPPRPAP